MERAGNSIVESVHETQQFTDEVLKSVDGINEKTRNIREASKAANELTKEFVEEAEKNTRKTTSSNESFRELQQVITSTHEGLEASLRAWIWALSELRKSQKVLKTYGPDLSDYEIVNTVEKLRIKPTMALNAASGGSRWRPRSRIRGGLRRSSKLAEFRPSFQDHSRDCQHAHSRDEEARIVVNPG